jgi:hypothetical protein
VVLFIFLVALGVTIARGPLIAFILVSLPCIFLLPEVPKIDIQLLPDPGAAFGAMYGILIGTLVRGGEPWTIHWNSIDTLVILIAVAKVINSVLTEYVYTGVSSSGAMFLGWVGPYFLARLAFQSVPARRQALKVVIFSIAVIAFFTLIETRLYPHFYRQQIHRLLGLPPLDQLAYLRYGFFRADGPFSHPIYLGNACIGLIGLTAILAATTPGGSRRWWVGGAILAAVFSVATSISYGSYLGLTATVLFYLSMRYWGWVRRNLRWLAIGAVACGFALTLALRMVSPVVNDSMPDTERSFRIRVLIIRHSWDFVESAGLFGHGIWIDPTVLQLESVDNSYLLWAMREGWVYLALWLLIPIVLGARASRAFRRTQDPRQREPLVRGLACIFGVMVAMYTVWADWDYVTIWTVLLGFTVSLAECYDRLPARTLPRGTARPVAARPALASRPAPALGSV